VCGERWLFTGDIGDECPSGVSDLECPRCGHRSGDFDAEDEPEYGLGPEALA
jgi:hypothetical protein